MKRTIALLIVLVMTAALCASAYGDKAKTKDIILMTEYQQMGWGETFQLGAVDAEGNLWAYESSTRGNVPYEKEELLTWAESTDKLELQGELSKAELADITSLVMTVPSQEVIYESFACDAGLQTSFAVSKDRDGDKNIVLLGTSGDDTYENTDPAAQALYKALRRLFPAVTAYDGEGMMAPAGFQETDILTFCGYEGPELTQLSMTAYTNDCEAGSAETKPQMSADELAGLKVTGKQNSMAVTGNTVTYCFTGKDGNIAAAFEFYGELLVRPDGMYSLAR